MIRRVVILAGLPAATGLLLTCAATGLLLLTCADTNPLVTVCDGGSYKCVGNLSLRCASDGSGWQVDADCVAKGQICTSRGCLTCEPGSLQCRGQDLVMCNDQGTGTLTKPIKTCDAGQGLTCDGDGCVNACELARRNRSYVGCEYWPVDLDNAVVDTGNAAAQQYAVVLSNPSSLAAQVKPHHRVRHPGRRHPVALGQLRLLHEPDKVGRGRDPEERAGSRQPHAPGLALSRGQARVVRERALPADRPGRHGDGEQDTGPAVLREPEPRDGGHVRSEEVLLEHLKNDFLVLEMSSNRFLHFQGTHV